LQSLLSISSVFYCSFVEQKTSLELVLFYFFFAGYLIEPKTPSSNGVALQRSNSLTSLTSTANADDLRVTTSEDYLRICLSCRQILQRRYDELCFKTADKEDVVVYYEQIVALRNELNQIQPTYAMMIESLL